MTGSPAEREIRDYAATRLREMMPEARIIHELVVGGCRADLAAVEPERITLVEIKSERDTLKRLSEQVRQFSRAAHQVIVIAHERWFDTTPYNSGHPRVAPTEALAKGSDGHDLWAYPELASRPLHGAWRTSPWRVNLPEPYAWRMLELLWKEELLAECRRHNIAAGSRSTCPTMMKDMAWLMTGREITQAVCRQLRGRPFPEADAPIFEERDAA